MSRKPKTLMEVIYASTGSLRRSGRIFALVICWAEALEQTGQQEINIEQYIAWAEPEWSRRTVERQLHDFREAFPGLRTPQPFAKRMLDHRADAQAQMFAPDYAAVA
jgi:hypothetical protein